MRCARLLSEMCQAAISSRNSGRVSAIKSVCVESNLRLLHDSLLNVRNRTYQTCLGLAYSRVTMDKNKSDYVRDLFSLVQVEQNQLKFLKLIQELNRVLSEEDYTPATNPLSIHN